MQQALKSKQLAEILTTAFKTKKLVELREIARSSGIYQQGTKSDIIQRLVSELPSKTPSSILSFDLGYRNLAYCVVTQDATILDWARIDLELTTFHPSVVAPVVRKFIKDRIEYNMKTVDLVLVEQQRARSNGSWTVLEHTLRVNSIEGMIWYGLYETANNIKRPDLDMIALSRQKVDAAWESELQRAAAQTAVNNRTTYKKKQAAVRLVQNWLNEKENSAIKLDDRLKDMFREEPKKDDLSDCLLQALAWYKWQQFKQNYVHLLTS
ncbi:ribonuclease H-like protein [Rhizopus microsporus var. microsporus]|uniref:Ribonuclease H-like protein n=2 Tax=Rhizopus microsporus TaxID=58291 RepID=A0A2G4SZE2_RHIZD|nr:ribonuclease H-like protein [Rhizopus microsporus ATCC 52813]ORE03983.1 ribonuclease H-like protein [Rhizopus microsporus var. microsporus]PHZ14138.1 ribonuclease H-like protein [Rhizopus microsporus ATCC 52813]